MLNPINDLDDRSHFDGDSGFLADFADERLAQRLADFNRAAWEAPFAFERLVGAAREEDAIAVNDDGADADDGPLGERARQYFQAPITFTTTRFFRWPSNSA